MSFMASGKLLLAEDDLLLQQLYKDTLVDEGYTINIASNGEEALEKMRTGGYDLVLLDIIMPKKDGLTVMKELKSSPPQAPNKKIVFLTNLDKDEEIKEAQSLGNGYIIKSQITPGDLVSEVEKYLSVDEM